MLGSGDIKGAVRKVAAAIIGFLLALALLAALLLTAFYLFVHAAVLALAPILGEAGAMATTGLVCLLLVVMFFWRMTGQKSSKKSKDASTDDSASVISKLRKLIQENPLEAVLAAFAIGIAEQGDPRLKSLLLQGGMELMSRQDAGMSSPDCNQSSDEPATS